MKSYSIEYEGTLTYLSDGESAITPKVEATRENVHMMSSLYGELCDGQAAQTHAAAYKMQIDAYHIRELKMTGKISRQQKAISEYRAQLDALIKMLKKEAP